MTAAQRRKREKQAERERQFAAMFGRPARGVETLGREDSGAACGEAFYTVKPGDRPIGIGTLSKMGDVFLQK